MTGTALHGRDIHSDIHRMLEGLGLELHFGEIRGRSLRQESVAGAAVIGDHLAVRAFVEPVMA